MKKILLLLLALSLTTTAWSLEVEECLETDSSIEEILKLGEEVNEITGSMTETKKVLTVTATKYYTNQGNGKVSVITDENGNLSGVRVDFAVKGQKNETLIKTFDEMKAGGKLEYKQGNTAPLVVQKASGADISAKTGGKFLFSVMTKKPGTYKHYTVYLRKEGSNWVVKNEGGKKLTAVDLTPNVSGFSWDGTFSEAEFE